MLALLGAAVVVEAESLAGQLSLLGMIVPAALVVAGLSLLLVAGMAGRRSDQDDDLTPQRLTEGYSGGSA